MTIKDMHQGDRALITVVGGEGSLRHHFLDMGLIPGAEVTFLKTAPQGDPVQICVQGYCLSLRLAEAGQISVTPVTVQPDAPSSGAADPDMPYMASLHDHNSHPGLGEAGRYHSKDHENPLPKGTTLTFALAGQQNCGKTTLFNVLTGANQHVGNFPGVTVDRKDGVIKGYPDTLVTDLPGIYSLSTYTSEELVSRDFILKDKPKGIINIVDAGNIERNLYLTVQLMELGVPMVLALNMMDELRSNGGSIRVNEMERLLGIPVVAISAAKQEGIEELVEHAVHVANYQEAPARKDFCDKDDHGGAVHRCLHSIMALVEDHAQRAGIPVRFAATRLAEGDELVLKQLGLDTNEKETLEHILEQMEAERGLDRKAAMADMRYSFIRKLCSQTVVKPQESKEYKRSLKIDKVLTSRWFSQLIFILVLGMIFWLTFDVIGTPLQDILDKGITWLGDRVGDAFDRWSVSPTVRSLVVDAIFGGVGSVLSFVPIIVVMFFFLSLLEDSGYMARIAFIADKSLRRLGLSGRSIVPMLIGFGCSVPGVMASRTLPSATDRRRTILLIPYMSCSAKIAIYGFLAAAFFPGHAGLVMTLLYLLGIFVGFVFALVSKHVRGHQDAAPFVMELPNYRLPRMRNVGHLLWDKTKDFCQRAFTIIFMATIVIWFLQSFDFRLNIVQDSYDSMLAWIAGIITPLFKPIGLGDWRLVTSLISGFLAKESVVSTMEVLGVTGALTVITAVPMLVFSLLYTPCVAAVASVKRELGGWWALFVVLFQCLVAWICSWIAYMIAALI